MHVSVNKVLLEHHHSYLFIYCLWLSSCYKVVSSSCDRDYKAYRVNMFTMWSFTKETHADFWSRVTANVSRFQNFSTRSGFNWCKSMCLSTQKWTAFNLNAYYLDHLLCDNYKEKLEQSNSRSKPLKAGRHFILMTVTAICFSYVLLCPKPTQNVPKAKISLQRIQASGGRCFASHLQSLTCLVVIRRRPESQMALLT